MPRSKINKKSHGLVYECVRLTGVFFWHLVRQRECDLPRPFQVHIQLKGRRPSGRRNDSWPGENTTKHWGLLDGRNSALIAGGDYLDTLRLVELAHVKEKNRPKQKTYISEHEADAFYDLFHFLHELSCDSVTGGDVLKAAEQLCYIADLPIEVVGRCRLAATLSGCNGCAVLADGESKLQKIALRLYAHINTLVGLLSLVTEPIEIFQAGRQGDCEQLRMREMIFQQHRWLKEIHAARLHTYAQSIAMGLKAKDNLRF
jgi:hypothetical protein